MKLRHTPRFDWEANMFSKSPILRIERLVLLVVAISAGLGACYVIPMNPDGSPA